MRKTGNFGFVVATIVLCLVATISFYKVASFGQNPEAVLMEEQFQEQEEMLQKEIRDYLEDCGFENSGVMITHVVDIDGSRTYTVTVHHSDITKLGEEERESLANELSAFTFEGANCTFQQDFLLAGL